MPGGIHVLIGDREVDLDDGCRSSRGDELSVDRVGNWERFGGERRGLDRAIGPRVRRGGVREPVRERGLDEVQEARRKTGSVGDPLRKESFRKLGLAGQEGRVLTVDAHDTRDVLQRRVARDGGADVQDDVLRVRIRQVRSVEEEHARRPALAAREEARELGIGLRARGGRRGARGRVRGHRTEEGKEWDRDDEQYHPEDHRMPRVADDPPPERGERPFLGRLSNLGSGFHRRPGMGFENNPIRGGLGVGDLSSVRASATVPGT